MKLYGKETHEDEMLYQYFIVYFHIQKDKIEIILSSIFSLTVRL